MQVGILGCILLLIFLASSMPVAFVMAAVGTIGFGMIVSPGAAFSMITTDLYSLPGKMIWSNIN